MDLFQMTCPSCGASLQFPKGLDRITCSYCETQLAVQSGGDFSELRVAEQRETWQWETCEIVWKKVKSPALFGMHKSKFWADAIGPNGKYNAGESPVFEHRWGYPGQDDDPGYKQTIDALNTLINSLVSAGWQPTGDRGNNIWNNRFRRCVK